MLEPQRENIGSISQIELYIAPMARLAVIQLGAADLHAKRQVVQHGWPHLGQFFPGSTQLSIPRPAQLGHLTPGIYQNMNFSNSGITRWFPMGHHSKAYANKRSTYRVGLRHVKPSNVQRRNVLVGPREERRVLPLVAGWWRHITVECL